MRFLGSLIAATLLIGVTFGQQPGEQEPSQPMKSQYWRDIQLEILNAPHIFPNNAIINQRYQLFLRPIVLNHVFETPSFHDFINYYTKNLKPENSLYDATKQSVKAALNQTFDLLVKQYGNLDAKMDIDKEIANQKTKRDTEQEMQAKLKFFLSDAFTEELLQKTGELLDQKMKVKREVAPEHVEDYHKEDELPIVKRLAVRFLGTVVVPIANKVTQRFDRTNREWQSHGLKAFFPFGPYTPFFLEADELEKEAQREAAAEEPTHKRLSVLPGQQQTTTFKPLNNDNKDVGASGPEKVKAREEMPAKP